MSQPHGGGECFSTCVVQATAIRSEVAKTFDRLSFRKVSSWLQTK